MINGEKTESIPVFVPPRKRQTSKKQNGVQNYVDHIVCVQVRVLMFHYHQKKMFNFSKFYCSQMIENIRYHQVWKTY